MKSTNRTKFYEIPAMCRMKASLMVLLDTLNLKKHLKQTLLKRRNSKNKRIWSPKNHRDVPKKSKRVSPRVKQILHFPLMVYLHIPITPRHLDKPPHRLEIMQRQII